MKRRLLVCLVIGTTACGPPASRKSSQVAIRLNSSSPEGNFYATGRVLGEAVEQALPDVRIEQPSVGGGVRNVDRLRDGKADLAFSFTNVAYAAYMGELREDSKPFGDLRGIAILDVAPLHFLVGPNSNIRTVADLRGKTIDSGGPGSGAGLAFNVLLQAFGLEPHDVHDTTPGYDAGLAGLVDGQIDAMFILGNYPSQPVERAMARGARLLSIAGPEIDRLRAAYPFFMPALIPEHGYAGLETTIRTIGVETLLLCRADLDERVVYAVTEAMMKTQQTASALTQSRYLGDLRQAAATPIPLHPGAARYYRERELLQ